MKKVIFINWDTGNEDEITCDSVEILDKKRVWMTSSFDGEEWCYRFYPISMYTVYVYSEKELMI